MVQVALTDFETYFESALDTLSNVTTVGALNSGSITSGFGAINNGSSAITTTGTVTYGSLSDGSITITAFVDEDDMSSNSATLVPTQQSVKAYVDTQITAEDLDVTTDSGTIAIDLDSETLTISGGTGLDSSATGNAVTLAIDSTVATLTGSQTLTNKSLTAPTLTGTATVASLDISGDIDVDGTTNLDVVDIDGAVDMASTLAVGGVVTANAGVVVDNTTFDANKLATSSGNFFIDSASDIYLDADGANIFLRDDGTNFGNFNKNGNNLKISSSIQDGDIVFAGDDGGSAITALTLDMSAAGAATFNSTVTASGTSVFASLDISGDIDVDGTTNLDVVDIDGAVDMASTLTVGSHLSVTNGASSFTRTHATTNASLQILDLKATSSGDMADGFGPSIHFSASDTGATSDQVAEINVVRAGSDTVFNLEFQTADTTRLTYFCASNHSQRRCRG
jgi:cytoskeletal protein CcmA (bactofilin family)